MPSVEADRPGTPHQNWPEMVVLEWVDFSTVADLVAVVKNLHLPQTTARYLPLGRLMVLAWAVPAVLSCVASFFQVTFTVGVRLPWQRWA